jgi:hypothetical protein
MRRTLEPKISLCGVHAAGQNRYAVRRNFEGFARLWVQESQRFVMSFSWSFPPSGTHSEICLEDPEPALKFPLGRRFFAAIEEILAVG